MLYNRHSKVSTSTHLPLNSRPKRKILVRFFKLPGYVLPQIFMTCELSMMAPLSNSGVTCWISRAFGTKAGKCIGLNMLLCLGRIFFCQNAKRNEMCVWLGCWRNEYGIFEYVECRVIIVYGWTTWDADAMLSYDTLLCYNLCIYICIYNIHYNTYHVHPDILPLPTSQLLKGTKSLTWLLTPQWLLVMRSLPAMRPKTPGEIHADFLLAGWVAEFRRWISAIVIYDVYFQIWVGHLFDKLSKVTITNRLLSK